MTITPTTTGEATGPPLQAGGRSKEKAPHLLVAQAAGTYLARLQPRYLKDESSAVAELARLRRGAGKRAHQVQDLWGIGGVEQLARVLADRPAIPRPEDAEEAVFLASTLWALHQQSRRDQGMYDRRQTLGGAVRELIRRSSTPGADEEEDSPLRKRLVRVGTAESLESVAVRLREIVLLLRGGDGVPLDYGHLAGQLYRWQYRPGRAAVQREWGREFHLAAARGAKSTKGAEGAKAVADAIDPTLRAEEGEYGDYAAGE